MATLVALAIFLPVWVPGPLSAGGFSLAFLVPFALAAWALTLPAPPGLVAHVIQGGYGRGLWLEAFCVGGVLLLAFLSMTYSPDPRRALRVILPMAYAVCALILLCRLPALQRRRLIYALVFSGVGAIGLAVLLMQTGSSRWVAPGYRLRAFFENSNQFGLMILAIWPLTIALLMNARTTRWRLICLVSVLVLAAAMFLSGTKTALALGFVSAAVLWLYHGSRAGSVGRALITVSLLLCGIIVSVPVMMWVLSWASPVTFDKVNDILSDGIWSYQSMESRDAIWEESVRIGLANPLLGEGAGVKVLGKTHSHNMLADYFRGMGVFGLIAAFVLMVSVVSRGSRFLLRTWHKGRDDREIDMLVAGMYLGSIAYILGNQLSDSFSPTTAFPFWMMYLGAYLTSWHLQPARAPAGDRVAAARWEPRGRRRVGTAVAALD